MRILTWALRFFQPPAPTDSEDTSVRKKSSEGWAFSGPITVAQVEAEWLRDRPESLMTRPDMPQEPFGFVNDRWEEFKAGLRHGDTLVQFSTDRASWENLAGREGLGILRHGYMVDKFVITMN